MPKPNRFRLLLALALGAIHTWLAFSLSDRHSAVYDEPAHLIAGIAYLREGDYRLHPENGLLPQILFALPLAYSAEIKRPAFEGPAWINADIWRLGLRLLHREGNAPADVLRRARLINALAGGTLVALITAWSWSAGGALGALLGGGLGTLSPALLAHAGFATSDTLGALGFAAATLAYWQLLHRVTAPRVLVAGGAAALLALSKHTAAIFPLVAGLLLIARLLRRAPLPIFGLGLLRTRTRRALALVLASVATVAVAWTLVWAAYGFRFEARSPRAPAEASFIKPWDDVLMVEPRPIVYPMADGSVPPGHESFLRAGAVQRAVAFARDHRLLPEAWLYGLAFVDRHSRFRLAYFAGEWSAVGWRTFFPVAYLVKSTPAELALHLLALTAVLGAWRGRNRTAYRALPIIAAGSVFTVFAISSSLNIGHRHLLLLYPLGCMLTSFLPRLIPRAKAGRTLPLGLVLAVLGAQAVSSFSIRPSYLAYFNFFGGGPDRGHLLLADSSLDWGQDLPALRDWLAAHPLPPQGKLYLSYFGNDSPRARGIDAIRLADAPFNHDPEPWVEPALSGGRYAISATMWTRVYTQVRGPWNAGYEALYQKMNAWLREIAERQAGIPETDAQGRPLRPENFLHELQIYDQLRFGRLVHQLRSRAPDARVAHNWFVFDLDQAEVRSALHGPLLP